MNDGNGWLRLHSYGRIVREQGQQMTGATAMYQNGSGEESCVTLQKILARQPWNRVFEFMRVMIWFPLLIIKFASAPGKSSCRCIQN